MPGQSDNPLLELSKKTGRDPQAYVFVFETSKAAGVYLEFGCIKPDDGYDRGESGYVSGREFCLAARMWAVQGYGEMASFVLGRLGIKTSEDLGQLVFDLVDNDLLGKSDTDDPSDFDGVCTFDDLHDPDLGDPDV